MTLNEWLRIAYSVAGFLLAFIPMLIGWIRSSKAKRKAKTEAEREAAENDMKNYAQGLITSAEQFYKSLDEVLKKQGESAGPYKKESVMNKLQAYATQKGYVLDVEFWSAKIDELVKFTKQVNM